jgi:tetratricopeptide (TPR) repeat protein
MRVWLWIGILLGCASAQSPPESAESHLKQAALAQSKNDTPGAIAELRRALQLSPDLREALAMLGGILLSEGFAAEALPHLEAAGDAYALALALTEVNRLPEALHKLLPVFAARPDDPAVLFHLGECSGSLMQQAFHRLLRLHPDSPRARELQRPTGQAPERTIGNEVQALDHALTAYDQHPDDPEVLFQLGDGAQRVMRYAFNRLLRSHSSSAWAQELQARTLLGQGRGAQAEPLFRNALAANPRLPGVHLAFGRILQEERGDLDAAEIEFRAEATLRPGDAEAAWRLGSLLLKKGQSKEALTALQQSDRLKPDMIETLLDLGAAYLSENQIPQAEKAFTRIIRIDDQDELAAAAHLRLSQICRRLGRIPEADQHLKRFRELSAPKGPSDGQRNHPGL